MDYSKTTRLSKISNIIFLVTSIFCIFFLWCNFYIKSIKISLISSLIVVLSLIIILFPILHYKKKKSSKNLSETSKTRNLKNLLLFANHIELNEIMSKIINFVDYKIISDTHIYNNNHDIFFIFTSNEFVNLELNLAIKNRITNNIIIYCIDQTVFNLDINVDNINIEYINIEQISEILNDKNIIIGNKYKLKKSAKLSVFYILCIVFNKTKSKNYLMFGLLLLFTSLITPYSTYYIIMSTILILLSIFSRFNTIFNKKSIR